MTEVTTFLFLILREKVLFIEKISSWPENLILNVQNAHKLSFFGWELPFITFLNFNKLRRSTIIIIISLQDHLWLLHFLLFRRFIRKFTCVLWLVCFIHRVLCLYFCHFLTFRDLYFSGLTKYTTKNKKCKVIRSGKKIYLSESFVFFRTLWWIY